MGLPWGPWWGWGGAGIGLGDPARKETDTHGAATPTPTPPHPSPWGHSGRPGSSVVRMRGADTRGGQARPGAGISLTHSVS